MISDNDYGLGIVVSGITHHPDWASTAIFIVEDDTQGCADHVDLHRSILARAFTPRRIDALETHMAAEHTQRFLAAAPSLTDGDPQMQLYRVAAQD